MKNTPRHQHLASAPAALIAVLLAITLTAAAPAAVFKQKADANSNGLSWETATLWNPEGAASAGNDYFTNGYNLRTSTPGGGTGSATFPGASLTVEGGDGGARGTLTLKTKTTTIGNLSIGIGTVTNNVNTGTNQPATLNVTNLTILSTATSSNQAILQGTNSNQDLTVNVTNLLGDGYLQFTNPRAYSLSVKNAAAFTGTLNLNQGTLTLTSAFTAPAASFSMRSEGQSVPLLVLANNLAVASFTYGSTTLNVAGSTYTSAQLNTLLGVTAFSGDGIISISSIPEPSTLAFFLGGSLLAVCCAARRSLRTARAVSIEM
ncbi:PEP-CTERM domain protein [Opitutaceae bacterium TAV4]|uniref:PEP-CTERM domain protein n=1 Tax=Geminisphaera colitermitum TaxID=1148786 RepID=UPI0001965590|nr:PEP-CTERM domain protein [Geminisphaera colitermitum]RRJ94797.1 PEP-CTERM domain protein [Opitutaceae bacterium TAV4]RRJ99031.1 PEP-CTERM domain protein [Opitutaceae bacterium TAV3]